MNRQGESYSERDQCPVYAAIRVIEGRWKPMIWRRLGEREHGFGELRRSMPGVTTKGAAPTLAAARRGRRCCPLGAARTGASRAISTDAARPDARPCLRSIVDVGCTPAHVLWRHTEASE